MLSVQSVGKYLLKRFLFSVRVWFRRAQPPSRYYQNRNHPSPQIRLAVRETCSVLPPGQNPVLKVFKGGLRNISCRQKLKELERTTRKPRLLLRLFGLLLFRLDTVQLFALLFQEPPRLTRLEPEAEPAYLVCWDFSLKI